MTRSIWVWNIIYGRFSLVKIFFHSVLVEKTQFLSSLFSLLLQAGCRKYVEVANRTNHIFLNSYVQVEFAINCNRTNYSNYLKITSKCSFCFPKGKKGSKFLLELRSLVSVNEKKNFNLSKQCTNFHFFFLFLLPIFIVCCRIWIQRRIVL